MSQASQDKTPDPILVTNTDPNIVQDQYKWTIHNATVNLPALLNDPRLVRRETDFFTKTWGQNFEKTEVLPSPYIPDIESQHFDKYIRKIAVVSCLEMLTSCGLLIFLHKSLYLMSKVVTVTFFIV